MSARPFVGHVLEARKRALAAMATADMPTWGDVEILVRATAPMSPREIDELVDRFGVDQYAAERVVHAILGKP